MGLQTKDGKAMPTMLQPITIYKPNFKEEKEWYSTAYYIAEDGSLKIMVLAGKIFAKSAVSVPMMKFPSGRGFWRLSRKTTLIKTAAQLV